MKRKTKSLGTKPEVQYFSSPDPAVRRIERLEEWLHTLVAVLDHPGHEAWLEAQLNSQSVVDLRGRGFLVLRRPVKQKRRKVMLKNAKILRAGPDGRIESYGSMGLKNVIICKDLWTFLVRHGYMELDYSLINQDFALAKEGKQDRVVRRAPVSG